MNSLVDARERRGTYEVTVLVEDHADVHVVVVEDDCAVRHFDFLGVDMR